MGIDRKRFRLKDEEDQINDDTWAEWLSNDTPSPRVRQELRERRVRQANGYTPRAAAPSQPPTPVPQVPPAGVSIQINLPEFHKPQFTHLKALWATLRARLTRRQVITVAAVLAVLLLSWAGLAWVMHRSHERAIQAAEAREAANAHTGTGGITKPTFTPAVPGTKPYLQVPDGVHSRFEPVKQIYTYVDTIGSKSFIVSQQHLPSDKTAAETAKAASKGLVGDVTTFTTSWGVAYEATDAQYGSQTLIFADHDKLLNIRASFSLPESQWQEYINNLK